MVGGVGGGVKVEGGKESPFRGGEGRGGEGRGGKGFKGRVMHDNMPIFSYNVA